MQMEKLGREGASLIECYQGIEWETKKVLERRGKSVMNE